MSIVSPPQDTSGRQTSPDSCSKLSPEQANVRCEDAPHAGPGLSREAAFPVSFKFIAPRLCGSGGGGLHTAITFRVWQVRDGLQPLFPFVQKGTRLVAKSPIPEGVQRKGRCLEPTVSTQVLGCPVLHTGEGVQGWRVHLGGDSSLPDWLTFQCHSRSRGASALLLVAGAVLALLVRNPPQLWLQGSGGLEPRPTPTPRTG